MEEYKAFATALRKAIDEHEENQATIAKKIGVSSSTLSEWLQGKYIPKFNKFPDIKRVLGVDPFQYFGVPEYEMKEIVPPHKVMEAESYSNYLSEKESDALLSQVKELAETLGFSDDVVFTRDLKGIIEAVNDNPLYRMHPYPYIGNPISKEKIEDSNFVRSLPTIMLHDGMLGKHAKSKTIFLAPMTDNGMNKIFRKYSIVAVDTGITLKEVHNEDIVLYYRNRKFFVRRIYIDNSEIDYTNYVMRPESRIPVFTDTVLKSKDFDLIGKVVMYTTIL